MPLSFTPVLAIVLLRAGAVLCAIALGALMAYWLIVPLRRWSR